MQIKFAHYGEERDLQLNSEEKEVTAFIYAMLENTQVDRDKLEVIRKSDSYATVVIRGKEYDFDLIRFKFTERIKWVSLPLSKDDRLKFQENKLFEAQKNKKQIHWKSKLQAIEELLNYKELVINAYNEGISDKNNFQ